MDHFIHVHADGTARLFRLIPGVDRAARYRGEIIYFTGPRAEIDAQCDAIDELLFVEPDMRKES